MLHVQIGFGSRVRLGSHAPGESVNSPAVFSTPVSKTIPNLFLRIKQARRLPSRMLIWGEKRPAERCCRLPLGAWIQY